MKATSAIVLFCICLGSVTAWWEIGHMAVSKIAENRLKELNETAALDKFTALVESFNDFTDGRSNTFVEAAVWPDDIKEYNTSYFDDYHFTDVVYDPQNLFVAMSSFQKDVNSINVVSSCMSVLKTNKQGITLERGFMARFLLHLVGDIHQPLHSVSMYNASLKTGDLGGNLIKIITSEDKDMNLHAFMDSMAGEQKDGVRIERPLNDAGQAYIRNLAGAISKEYPPSYFDDKLLNDTSSHSWVIESYNSAVQKVYPFVFKNKKLSQEYTDEMFKLCRERVALAGYRLANMIASIWK